MAHVVVVLGAAGRTGRLVVERALARGMSVRALARSRDRLGALAERVSVIEGDATDPRALAQAMTGATVVVQAISMPSIFDSGLHTRAMPLIVAAMREAGIRRYVGLTSTMAALAGDHASPLTRAMLAIGGVAVRGYVADKRAEVDALASADLDWTLVRVGGELRDGPDGAVRADPHRLAMRSATRAAVATFIVKVIEEESFVREGPVVTGP